MLYPLSYGRLKTCPLPIVPPRMTAASPRSSGRRRGRKRRQAAAPKGGRLSCGGKLSSLPVSADTKSAAAPSVAAKFRFAELRRLEVGDHGRAGAHSPLTWICRGRTASAFGRCTVSTPFLHSASMRLASIDSWMVKVR
jgi:hypothetical protein